MKLNLQDSIVLVTGGTRGIGRGIVEAFLAEEASVAYCSRAATGNEYSNPKAKGYAVDVTDTEQVKKWVEQVAADLGGIDIVISNVSAMKVDSTPENWELSFKIDIQAAVTLVDASLSHLLASKKSPCIIQIGSIASRFTAMPSAGPYGVFKAALTHYSKSLAKDLAPKGIRVNTLTLGSFLCEDGVWAKVKVSKPELFDHVVSSIPLGRMGTLEEVGNTAVFLASPLSSYTTGANFVLDGAASPGIYL